MSVTRGSALARVLPIGKIWARRCPLDCRHRNRRVRAMQGWGVPGVGYRGRLRRTPLPSGLVSIHGLGGELTSNTTLGSHESLCVVFLVRYFLLSPTCFDLLGSPRVMETRPCAGLREADLRHPHQNRRCRPCLHWRAPVAGAVVVSHLAPLIDHAFSASVMGSLVGVVVSSAASLAEEGILAAHVLTPSVAAP